MSLLLLRFTDQGTHGFGYARALALPFFNLVKVDGDQEMQKYLRILRGHVLQVIINELEQSNY